MSCRESNPDSHIRVRKAEVGWMYQRGGDGQFAADKSDLTMRCSDLTIRDSFSRPYCTEQSRGELSDATGKKRSCSKGTPYHIIQSRSFTFYNLQTRTSFYHCQTKPLSGMYSPYCISSSIFLLFSFFLSFAAATIDSPLSLIQNCASQTSKGHTHTHIYIYIVVRK